LTGYGPERVGEGGTFAAQAGAFASKENAEAMKERLEKKYHPVRVVEREGSKAPWRVLVGAKAEEGEARRLAEEIRKETGAEAYVVRLDSPK
jgi:cell division septation protein DedD